MANRNWASGGKIYSMRVKPVQLDCEFTVDNTSPSGVSNLKGPAVKAVFMDAGASPSALNPNPAAGTILVQLQDAYNQVLAVEHSIISPLAGSPSTATVSGKASVITTLGTATAAQAAADLQAVGLPIGIVPAIGVSFIATATATIGHSIAVDLPAAAGSGVATIELAADPDATVSPDPTQNQGFGAQMILQCRDYAGALVAPAAGSRISLVILLNDSSVATSI